MAASRYLKPLTQRLNPRANPGTNAAKWVLYLIHNSRMPTKRIYQVCRSVAHTIATDPKATTSKRRAARELERFFAFQLKGWKGGQ